MKRIAQRLIVAGCLTLTIGCAATGKTDNTFTLTADLPPDFAYVASVTYVPAAGQVCNLEQNDNLKPQFNREWRTEYKPDSQIELRRTRKGCDLVLYSVELDINASYGKSWSQFSTDVGKISVRESLDARYKGSFNAAGESEMTGQCEFLFRTIGPKRYIAKLLNCRSTDAQGNVTKGHPFAAYSLDQLPGKTVRLKIKLANEQRPYMKGTWVKLPNGWKRCMGESYEDQDAFCHGNFKDFSTFRMPDDRVCTIYPGCTENKDVTP